MSQKNQPLASPRKHPHSLEKKIFMLACLALPAVFYLATSHPAFSSVFLSGLTCISIYFARLSGKK